jgi:hypothetical protein
MKELPDNFLPDFSTYKSRVPIWVHHIQKNERHAQQYGKHEKDDCVEHRLREGSPENRAGFQTWSTPC